MKVNSQLELEQQNLEIMITRTMTNISKAVNSKTVSELKQVNNIIPFYVSELETKINVYLQETLLGRARVKPVPAKALTLLSPLTVAHFTVKTLINFAGSKLGNSTSIYKMIATQLETEFNLESIRNKDSEKHEMFVTYLKSTGYRGQRLQKITNDLLAKYHKDILDKKLDHVFMQVSQLAVTLLAECQPLIEGSVAPPIIYMSTIHDRSDKTKSKTIIMLADWITNWMKDQTLQGNMIPSYNTALIEPPKPWVALRSGGFHSERFTNNFVKTAVDPNKLDVNGMRATMRAVNIIQETEWEINKEVLEVMLYAFENKLNWGDLPSPKEVLSTPYPFPELTRNQMTDDQRKIVKDWAAHKAALHDEKHSEISRYLSLNRVLNEAKRFSEYDALYFAYQVDFRGRIYPIAANLHPQGSSFVKPLLRFKNGKRITTKEAEMYLALQGANTYGEDKLRLDEKLDWVIKNEEKIFLCAQDPRNHTDFWCNAEEAWSFLAFCFEWYHYKTNPDTFISKIPVALDGSCNGLQHLSAILRDEVGGAEVNLTKHLTKKDIYSSVKEIVIQSLKDMRDPLASRILEFGVERSTCKRPVMIVPYAGTQSSCREYVMADFVERGGREFFKDDFKAAVNLTSSVVWQSIGLVVIKGREIMTWFKKSARMAAKAVPDCELQWRTPNGFHVIQRRVKSKEVLYQTSMGDKINTRLSLRLHQDTDVNDLAGHSSSVCPNFIHSLDACALQETVTRAKLCGLDNFAMIHDSYGTLAEDTPLMARLLREVFVDMYRDNNVIGDWIKSQPKEVRSKFPELPSFGTLDLREVLESEHFFA